MLSYHYCSDLFAHQYAMSIPVLNGNTVDHINSTDNENHPVQNPFPWMVVLQPHHTSEHVDDISYVTQSSIDSADSKGIVVVDTSRCNRKSSTVSSAHPLRDLPFNHSNLATTDNLSSVTSIKQPFLPSLSCFNPSPSLDKWYSSFHLIENHSLDLIAMNVLNALACFTGAESTSSSNCSSNANISKSPSVSSQSSSIPSSLTDSIGFQSPSSVSYEDEKSNVSTPPVHTANRRLFYLLSELFDIIDHSCLSNGHGDIDYMEVFVHKLDEFLKEYPSVDIDICFSNDILIQSEILVNIFGPDPPYFNHSLFSYATLRNCTDIVNVLLEYGADCCHKDNTGNAVEQGHLTLLHKLLSISSMDINSDDNNVLARCLLNEKLHSIAISSPKNKEEGRNAYLALVSECINHFAINSRGIENIIPRVLMQIDIECTNAGILPNHWNVKSTTSTVAEIKRDFLKTIYISATNVSPQNILQWWISTLEDGPMSVADFHFLFHDIGIAREELDDLFDLSSLLHYANTIEAFAYLMKVEGLSCDDHISLLMKPLSLSVIKYLIEICGLSPIQSTSRLISRPLLHHKLLQIKRIGEMNEIIEQLRYFIFDIGLDAHIIDPETGFNLILTACSCGAPLSIIKFLVEDIGLSPNFRGLEDNSTSLMLLSDSFDVSRYHEYLQTISYLIRDHNVDINTKDIEGRSALMRLVSCVQDKLYLRIDEKRAFSCIMQLIHTFGANRNDISMYIAKKTASKHSLGVTNTNNGEYSDSDSSSSKRSRRG